MSSPPFIFQNASSRIGSAMTSHAQSALTMSRVYSLRSRNIEQAQTRSTARALKWSASQKSLRGPLPAPEKSPRGFRSSLNRNYRSLRSVDAVTDTTTDATSTSSQDSTVGSYVSKLRSRSRPGLFPPVVRRTAEIAEHGRFVILRRMRSRPPGIRNPAPSWHTGLRFDWTSEDTLTSSAAMSELTADSADDHSSGSDENRATNEEDAPAGKQSRTDYKVIRMPGDGRCLFHAIAYGACKRSGVDLPSNDLSHQREMADELRAKVADEFVKRKDECEWFIEGNFDRYVRNMRKPHVWGGEPELLMTSHVLRAPITVYIPHPNNRGGIISIAEYGQEHASKFQADIAVLYNGSSHYDALEFVTTHTDPLSKL